MKKTILLIILAIAILLIIFLPNSAMAADITDFVIDGSEIMPFGGTTPKLLTIDEDEAYIIKKQNWEDMSGNPVTMFVTGETYKYKLVLEAKEGNRFYITMDSKTEIANIMSQSISMTYPNENIVEIEMEILVPNPYTITVEASEGVNVTPNGNFIVYQGYNKEIKITRKEGYELTSVKVNDVEKYPYADNCEASFMNNVLTLNDVQQDTKIVIEAKKVVDSIEIKTNKPMVGKIPTDLVVELLETEKSSIKEVRIFDSETGEIDDHGIMKSDEKFEAGKYYELYLELSAKDIPFGEDVEATVNGKEVMTMVTPQGDLVIKYQFGLLEDEKDEKDEIKNEGINNEKEQNSGMGVAIPQPSETITEQVDQTPANTSNNPKTGDSITLSVALFVISAIGIVITTKNKKH